MSQTQQDLFNHLALSSNRDWLSMIRARLAKELAISKIAQSRSSIGFATNATATATSQKNWPPPSDPEFNLPDESRNFVLGKLPRCPICNWSPTLERTSDCLGKVVYRVHCRALGHMMRTNHPETATAYFNYASDAVNAWRLYVALAAI